MVKQRADKETTALTENYTIDYDSNSGSEEPKKRNKKERFEKSIDVLVPLFVSIVNCQEPLIVIHANNVKLPEKKDFAKISFISDKMTVKRSK